MHRFIYVKINLQVMLALLCKPDAENLSREANVGAASRIQLPAPQAHVLM